MGGFIHLVNEDRGLSGLLFMRRDDAAFPFFQTSGPDGTARF